MIEKKTYQKKEWKVSNQKKLMDYGRMLVNACWSEPITTSAPIQDEAVQAILGMNQKHILPCLRFLVFLASLLAQKFSLLPTYLISFCTHSIIKVQENLKQEGTRGRVELRTISKKVELGARSGRAKVAPKKKYLKWKGTSKKAQMGAKSERAEWELEGKFLPFFSFCFVVFLCVLLRRRWQHLAIVIFFRGGVATMKVTSVALLPPSSLCLKSFWSTHLCTSFIYIIFLTHYMIILTKTLFTVYQKSLK